MGTKILESTSGRSSHGILPWFSLTVEDGFILTGSVAWSGNWIVRFEPKPDGRYLISGGLSNWHFTKILNPGEVMQTPNVIYTYLHNGSLKDTSLEFGKWGKKYWYQKNDLSESMPVEWNTWWPYEDDLVNEKVFRDNVDKCTETGVEVCTLDAGWFGMTENNADWYKVRGDWHKVNTRRFPSGIRALSDYTHTRGLKFGIWCEIEALGSEAELNLLHPELTARRNGNHLGYVCMGNPESVKWAFGVLETLIGDYKADWIKLDFKSCGAPPPCFILQNACTGHGRKPGRVLKPTSITNPSSRICRGTSWIITSMLGGFGYSYRMLELPVWVIERLKYHTEFYKSKVSEFIRDAEMVCLTGQALRGGGGDRWNAFQYTGGDRGRALLFIFRLQGGESKRVIKPVYSIQNEDSGKCITMKGNELMEQGILFDSLEEESSAVLFIQHQI